MVFAMQCCVLFVALIGGISSLSCRSELARTGQPTVTRGEKKDIHEQPALQKEALRLPLKDPRIIVKKSERKLELVSDNVVVRTYRIGLGLNPIDDKQRQGDRATPEGEFYIFTKNDKSAYYLSLGISYPNVEDAERGLRDGMISRAQRDAIVKTINRKGTPPQNTALGGDIYIHGNGASSDWTWGCVALENEDVRELFDAVPVGTAVTIKH